MANLLEDQKMIQHEIHDEMKNSYIDYAMSVIVGRCLLYTSGHYILENNPSSKVLYVSSEMFTSELVKAIQDKKNYNSKMRFFKNKYRNVDVLLIDDIQFIEGKESTQVEFFHTFNALYECDKQIVISSDRHPSKLTDLDERLRSRFQWNVIADIQPPDFETRVAILRNKAQLENIDLNDDDILEVIDLIAEKVKYNIREMCIRDSSICLTLFTIVLSCCDSSPP